MATETIFISLKLMVLFRLTIPTTLVFFISICWTPKYIMIKSIAIANQQKSLESKGSSLISNFSSQLKNITIPNITIKMQVNLKYYGVCLKIYNSSSILQ